jgi:solute carrier family 25 phosphate transporter 23/24/25/41
MQVVGMQGGHIKYNGAIDALTSILRVEGVRGLYRGLWPNLRTSLVVDIKLHCTDHVLRLVKVAPSIATSFFTYELVCPQYLSGNRLHANSCNRSKSS